MLNHYSVRPLCKGWEDQSNLSKYLIIMHLFEDLSKDFKITCQDESYGWMKKKKTKSSESYSLQILIPTFQFFALPLKYATQLSQKNKYNSVININDLAPANLLILRYQLICLNGSTPPLHHLRRETTRAIAWQLSLWQMRERMKKFYCDINVYLKNMQINWIGFLGLKQDQQSGTFVQCWMFKGGDFHQESKGYLVCWFITYSVHQSGLLNHSITHNLFWHMKSRILITDRFIIIMIISLPNKATPGYLRPQRITSFNLYTDNLLFSDLIYPYLCAWPTLSLFVDTSSKLTKPSYLLT